MPQGRDQVVSAVDICVECGKLVVEGIAHEALGSEVITLVRLDCGNHLKETWETLDRAGVQRDPISHHLEPRKAVRGVLQRDAANQPVYLVTFREQQFRKIGSILSGDSGDQSSL